MLCISVVPMLTFSQTENNITMLEMHIYYSRNGGLRGEDGVPGLESRGVALSRWCGSDSNICLKNGGISRR